jgi:hypothetical protein
MAEGDSRNIETGEEDKDKGSFKLPEMFGGAGAPVAANAKGGKAPPPKADPKKPSKGAAVGGGVD